MKGPDVVDKQERAVVHYIAVRIVQLCTWVVPAIPELALALVKR